MFRSLHLYGYGLLLLSVFAVAGAWWTDHTQLSQRAATFDANAEKLADELNRSQTDHARRAALMNGEVDFLVAELQKTGVRIERMTGGGFRRTYGNVPSNPSEFAGETLIINGPEDVARLPKDRQPIYMPR